MKISIKKWGTRVKIILNDDPDERKPKEIILTESQADTVVAAINAAKDAKPFQLDLEI